MRRGKKRKNSGSGGIRTHAIEMTGALNQRLRPLGHATNHTIEASNCHTITVPGSIGTLLRGSDAECHFLAGKQLEISKMTLI